MVHRCVEVAIAVSVIIYIDIVSHAHSKSCSFSSHKASVYKRQVIWVYPPMDTRIRANTVEDVASCKHLLLLVALRFLLGLQRLHDRFHSLHRKLA
jgi:hypothetical protein